MMMPLVSLYLFIPSLSFPFSFSLQDSPSPASSTTGDEREEKRGIDHRNRPISSFDDDSDVEHLLNGMESDRTNASLPPPPPR